MCFEMWNSTKSGLSPECVTIQKESPHRISKVPGNCGHSMLRPETAESLYLLHRLTRDVKYREWGERLFRAINEHSRTEVAFATVDDVEKVPTSKRDELQSFVFAETFKYLYLLFASPDLLDLDKYVLNTEGHPLRKFSEIGRP